MDGAVEKAALLETHRSTPVGMLFYSALDDVLADVELLGYYSVIRRAWEALGLDGVLFQDGRPALYLKENDRPFSPP